MLVLTQTRKALLREFAEDADLEARVHAAARLAADAEDPELRESTVDALYGVWAAWERRGRRKAKSQASQGPEYWAEKASSLRAALDPHLARMFDAAMDASTHHKSEFHGRYEDARRSAFAALQSERLQDLEPGAPPPRPRRRRRRDL